MKINNEKITKEFCKDKTLIFFPKTEDEAAFIQRKIFEMGFKWKNGGVDICYTAKCVEGGMELEDGKIYTDPPASDRESGLLCTASQFDEDYMSPHDQIMAQFNKMAARIEEISKKVDAMYDQVMPQKLDKPTLKNPGDPAP